ncbi:beta-galactosidase [Microbacterium aurantiacum]|uniref:Beta-galactosidase n=1 Tax=Microbacterium aurantiacum TaxID=162393 RepID=A0ABT8FUL4_9MICO|nr:beta-galactosidase [Microbacterium aurantiacum]MDN4465009.1 beta-galactosidase [Microbacterium aurantiacum]
MTSIEALRLPSRVWFGGDYNPEQWPDAVLIEDIDLMAQASVNTATVGVFSWAALEPRPGAYDFAWLDEAMDRLHAAGISVILATPTASPPPWFSRLHPEALPVTADGVSLLHGSRDTYNPAAPAYREAARRITTVLAERYGDHPALTMWHLHNEYGTVSYGPTTDIAFRAWLQRVYGDLDALNSTWNTAFWSQVYSSWDDIYAPQKTQYLHNPAHLLDFKRFSSDTLLDCLRDQLAIVKEITPYVPTTTNFMLPTWHHYDEWDFARELDVVSIDHYPEDGPSGDAQVALAADLARSWAGRRPWLLMEQATSLVYDYAGGRMLAKAPGRMRRNTYQYLARGSFGSMFFQWRAPRVGAEFFHSAMVPHVGSDSRVFREIRDLGAELTRLPELATGPVEGDVVEARVAIVWDSTSWWATETRMLPSDDVGYLPAVRRIHEALWRSGVTVDFVNPDADFTSYRLVLIPSMLAVSETQREAFTRFVESGGHLAVWYLSGSTDEYLRVRPGTYSAAFADLAGVRIEEHAPLREGETVLLTDGSRGSAWSEVVQLRGADQIAAYAEGAPSVIASGAPAITRNVHGAGIVHYFSTRVEDDDLARHLIRIVDDAGVETGAFPGDVESVVRRTATGDLTFFINHGERSQTVSATGRELLSDTDVDGEFVVAPGDVAVVRIDASPEVSRK